MPPDSTMTPPHDWQMVARRASCPGKIPQALQTHASTQPPPDEPATHETDLESQIDHALALLEGRDNTPGRYCCCETNCRCRFLCKRAARETTCPCDCFRELMRDHVALNAKPFDDAHARDETQAQEESQAEQEAHVQEEAQAHQEARVQQEAQAEQGAQVAEEAQAPEERATTPRSMSVYSQNSIQASIHYAHVQTPTNHQSLPPIEGTWSVSRAELWTRLRPPGPPTPTTPTRPQSGKG